MSNEVMVGFCSESGSALARLTFYGEFGAEALEENGRYEYELDSPGFSLREVPGVIRHSRILQACERGTIEPGNYVGLLKLALVEKGSGAAVAETHVDVRSRKLGYEDEYRSMLEDLADRCSDFLLQLESPVEQRFNPEDTDHEPTLAQRLYFLKSLLGGEAFFMVRENTGAVDRFSGLFPMDPRYFPASDWLRKDIPETLRNPTIWCLNLKDCLKRIRFRAMIGIFHKSRGSEMPVLLPCRRGEFR
ncbi:MAG: DUF2357 domain-containing protein [Verrucomicrobia bacterium]|nr:DUF2357 domain-containing protein [Verrucomicrobiota bacterium]MCH8528824.1 DUF2357 domain-containing protein [Kiritimatiellia bacterium]